MPCVGAVTSLSEPGPARFCGPNRNAAVNGATPGEIIPPTAMPTGRWNRDAGAADSPAGQAAVAERAQPHYTHLPQPERVG